MNSQENIFPETFELKGRIINAFPAGEGDVFLLVRNEDGKADIVDALRQIMEIREWLGEHESTGTFIARLKAGSEKEYWDSIDEFEGDDEGEFDIESDE